MFRLIALWLAALAGAVLLILLREERLAARGRVPVGRLRRLWLKPERRRAPRYRVDWPVRYARLTNHPPNPARTRDVSRTGAGLILSEKLPAGTVLELDLALPGRPSPLKATAEVVWSKEAPPTQAAGGERRFFVGVRFRGLDDHVAAELARTLAAQGKPERPGGAKGG